MSKAIVLYNSRGGNTKQVALQIAKGLGVSAKSHKNIPDLADFDLIVVGSWAIMGRISFAGARYLKKLRKKNIDGKKFALFFTSGGPEEINPMDKKNGPKTMYQTMFGTMERILTKKNHIEILSDRYYSMGAIRIRKHGPPNSNADHPSAEELDQALKFGEQLKIVLV